LAPFEDGLVSEDPFLFQKVAINARNGGLSRPRIAIKSHAHLLLLHIDTSLAIEINPGRL
jgi:hypothetical protein